jgi:DNA (cytosine-5)-methyltransferase 1
MLKRPLALDLFCCGGGAAMGLHRAGFDVIGIDIKPQPYYPFQFIQGDATRPPVELAKFDFIWASPPCQFASVATPDRSQHENLIPQTRELLATLRAGQLYCIENVPGAGLRADLVLDGTMFPDLKVIRRRHFEANFPMAMRLGFEANGHVKAHGWSSVFGGGMRKNGRNRMGDWREAMGIDWLPRRYLSQAIPPAYSEYIGLEALRFLGGL